MKLENKKMDFNTPLKIKVLSMLPSSFIIIYYVYKKFSSAAANFLAPHPCSFSLCGWILKSYHDKCNSSVSNWLFKSCDGFSSPL